MAGPVTMPGFIDGENSRLGGGGLQDGLGTAV